MVAFHLAPNIHFCTLDGAYVFLDAGADRYYAFVGTMAGLFSEILTADQAHPISPKASRFADHLFRTGLLRSPGTTDRPSQACTAPLPTLSRFEEAHLYSGGPLFPELPVLAAAFARSLALKHRQSLSGVLAGARRWKQAVSPRPVKTLDEATTLTGQFLAMSPFLFTSRNACLFRSLFLMRYLAARGIAPTWTFGVRLAPFGAHCWIEYQGAVLNDPLEHVAAFTPILAI